MQPTGVRIDQENIHVSTIYNTCFKATCPYIWEGFIYAPQVTALFPLFRICSKHFFHIKIIGNISNSQIYTVIRFWDRFWDRKMRKDRIKTFLKNFSDDLRLKEKILIFFKEKRLRTYLLSLHLNLFQHCPKLLYLSLFFL